MISDIGKVFGELFRPLFILPMVGHLGLSFKAPFSLLKQLSLLLLSLTGTSTPALEEPPLKVDYLNVIRTL